MNFIVNLAVTMWSWCLSWIDKYPGTTPEFRAFAKLHAAKLAGTRVVKETADVIFWYPEESRIYIYYWQERQKSPFEGDTDGVKIYSLAQRSSRSIPPWPGTY